ncbi:MAG: proton-conducting transporter membrane subunit [Devosia sp.]
MHNAPTAIADWIIVLPVVLGIMGGAVLLMLRAFTRIQPWITAVLLLVILIADAALFGRVSTVGPMAMTMGNWLPPFGISFVADVLGAGFALVAAFTALVVVVYLQMDTPETARRDGLYPLVLLLVAGVHGAFLTGDIFNLYVWFEVTLISTFGLMVLAGGPLQLDGAVKYGILNFLATSLFLLGLGLLYGLLGTLNMADIVRVAPGADSSSLTSVAALLMLAFGIKAAAFPVNAWLPAAYHTPPPAISALMAGLLTKVGAYALLRTLVFLFPDALVRLEPVVLAAAVATMLLGALGAIAETNLRRALGFMLIGGIGIMLAALAWPSERAIAGAALYGVHAMLTVTALYLVAGLVEKGMAKGGVMSAVLLVLLLSISGVPPFLGFWPKLVLLQGLFQGSDFVHVTKSPDWRAIVLVVTVLLNGLLTLIAGIRFWIRLYWKQEPATSTAGSLSGIGSVLVLTAFCFVIGLWPNRLIESALLAANGLVNPAPYVETVGLAP